MTPPVAKSVLDPIQGTQKNEIAPADLKQRLDQGEDVLVLDVRGEEEFDEWHIPGAVNLPIQEVAAGAEPPVEDGQTIVTVCAVGVRSAKAQQILLDRGYNVVNLHNGMMGWNRVFNVVPVAGIDLPGETELLQFQRIGKGCLSYMLVSEGEALVVDPANDWRVYQDSARARGVEITAVVDTHAHADHVSGGPAMASALDVPYYLHPYDGIHPIDMLPAEIDYTPLTEGQHLTVGAATVDVLHVPGHTLGNLALLVEDQAVLTGDTVFVNSIARPDLGGQAETWTPLHHRSLNRLINLSKDTVVLPGHFGDVSEASDGFFGETIETLLEENAGLREATKDLESFREFILASLPSFPERYVDIKRVNAGLKQVDEDELKDLEFGKQECAVSD